MSEEKNKNQAEEKAEKSATEPKESSTTLAWVILIIVAVLFSTFATYVFMSKSLGKDEGKNQAATSAQNPAVAQPTTPITPVASDAPLGNSTTEPAGIGVTVASGNVTVKPVVNIDWELQQVDGGLNGINASHFSDNLMSDDAAGL